MSECVDLGEEVRDKESGRPVVFDSLPLYNHVQRSFASLRMITQSSSLASSGDKDRREIRFVISTSSR